MGQNIDWLNIGSLLLILFMSLVVGLIIFKKGQGNRKFDFFGAHIMWTLAWFAWFCGWFAWFSGASPITVDILEDIGAILLIGLCVAYMHGLEKLKTYGIGLGALFLVIVIILITAGQALKWHPDADIQVLQLIINRTMLFGTSLCLVTFALVLVGWTFIEYFPQWEWSTPFGLLAVVYAVFQVHLFQQLLFAPPGIVMPSWWRVAFISWRLGFVLTYFILIMESALIAVPFAKIWKLITTVAPPVITAVKWMLG